MDGGYEIPSVTPVRPSEKGTLPRVLYTQTYPFLKSMTFVLVSLERFLPT